MSSPNLCLSLHITPPLLNSYFLLHTLKAVDGRFGNGRQIDQLVYEFYGLAEDEIKIVERTFNE